MDAIKAKITELAARPDGMCGMDLRDQFTLHDINMVANRLVDRGELFKVKVSHKVVRFFARIADADEYYRRNVLTSAGVRTTVLRAPPGEGIVTDKTIITICPPCGQRNQVVELKHVYGQRGRL